MHIASGRTSIAGRSSWFFSQVFNTCQCSAACRKQRECCGNIYIYKYISSECADNGARFAWHGAARTYGYVSKIIAFKGKGMIVWKILRVRVPDWVLGSAAWGVLPTCSGALHPRCERPGPGCDIKIPPSDLLDPSHHLLPSRPQLKGAHVISERRRAAWSQAAPPVLGSHCATLNLDSFNALQ